MNQNPDAASSKKVALILASLSNFLVPFMVTSLNVALPTIGKELSMDAVLLSWIPTGYLLAAAIFLLPFGRLADIYGRKKLFLLGTIVYTIACVLLPLSRTSFMFIAFRVVEGLGSAAIFATAIAILTSMFPPGERGKALGISAAAIYLGGSLGPPVGGFLTGYLTWRSIFYINIVIGLVVIYLVTTKLKFEWREAKGEKLDYGGSIVYGISLSALIIGFSFVNEFYGLLLTAAGIIGLGAFLWIENRIKSPVLNLEVFKKNRTFLWSNIAALINYCTSVGTGFLISLYLQYIKGYNAEHAGLILLAQPVVMMILSPIAGRLSDKMEPRLVATGGMCLTLTGLILFTFLSNSTPIWYIVMALLILGFGFGLFSSPNTNAAMGAVDKKFFGVASGMLSTMRTLGQMLSISIPTLLFALYIGRVQISPEYYPMFLRAAKTAFVVFSCLCFAGIFASLARGKSKNIPGGAPGGH